MSALLQLSKWLDRLNEFVGRNVAWLELAAVLISAINAVVRKAFNMSSNAWLEVQWYMFGAVVIDPPDLHPVDREYLLVQSEVHLDGDQIRLESVLRTRQQGRELGHDCPPAAAS